MQEVEAVKSAGHLAQLEAHLAEREAIYFDVWKFGVNTALRITDLVSIPMGDARALDAEHPVLAIRETKTGKPRSITLNRGALAVVERRLERHADDAWLFQSTSARHSRRDPPRAVSGDRARPVTRLSAVPIPGTAFDAGSRRPRPSGRRVS